MSTRRPPRPVTPRRGEPAGGRPTGGGRRAGGQRTSGQRGPGQRGNGQTPPGGARTVPAAGSGRGAPAPRGPGEGPRTAEGPRESTRVLEARRPAAPEPDREPGPGRVVQAADRFRALMAPRPWLRRRRTLLAIAAGLAAVLLAAVGVLLFAPAFRVGEVHVAGTGYVSAATVEQAAAGAIGSSILTVPTGEVAAEVEAIPGVRSAEVTRSWPDGVRVRVLEREPLAAVARPDGTTAVVDAEGVELPPEAAEGASLVPLTVGAGSTDADGAADAMIAVLAELPPELRGATSAVSATSRSDVTLTVAVEGGQKTVVWGDARDGELKAQVVAALLSQPGTVIDVSSPVAPVTR